MSEHWLKSAVCIQKKKNAKIKVPIREAAGHISGEFVMAYPPGIPILAPGEEITDEIIDYIQYSVEKGCSMQGMEDSTLQTLNVLRM